MRVHRILAICILVALGCEPAWNGRNRATSTLIELPNAEGPQAMPARITNQFGMTFCLIEIDPSRADHQDLFPNRSYYLQETELTSEQHERFRRAAFGDGTYESINWNSNNGYPSEWREVLRYGQALSKFDNRYNYRLPSQREWTFACMNGYDQTCPGDGAKSTMDSSDSSRPNKYGIKGFMNHDAECADVPGLFLGKSDSWPRANENWEKSACRCNEFTTGNPDTDDGLNELIAGRFVLITNSEHSDVGG